MSITTKQLFHGQAQEGIDFESYFQTYFLIQLLLFIFKILKLILFYELSLVGLG